MARERAPTINDENQLDIEQQTRRLTDPLPGTEQPYVYEHSVQSLNLDLHGREIPNPIPMSPPIGYKKSLSIAEQMRQMIRQASYEAKMAGAETEQEANDFDVGEDYDPTTPYEHDFEMDPELEAMIALQSRPPAPLAPAPKSVKEPSEAAPLQPQAK